MAYSDSVKQAIRTDYIRGKTLKAAAEYNGVPYETARGWKRKAESMGDCWETAKAALRLSAGGVKSLTAEILEDFVHLFNATITDLKNDKKLSPILKAEAISRLSDAYQKTVKAAGASNPELSRLAIAMDVLQRQAKFIHQNAPELQELFLQMLEPFGRELQRAYQ